MRWRAGRNVLDVVDPPDRSSLLTRIATTVNALLCARMKVDGFCGTRISDPRLRQVYLTSRRDFLKTRRRWVWLGPRILPPRFFALDGEVLTAGRQSKPFWLRRRDHFTSVGWIRGADSRNLLTSIAGRKVDPLSHSFAVIFIPTNVAPLKPRRANSVALNSGIAKSIHVWYRNTIPNTIFHTSS